MDFSALAKTIVSAGLPILGGAIGGPGGAMVAHMITGALGLDAGASPDAIATAISTNPDNVVKLRELELNHQEVLMKMAYDAQAAADASAAAQLESVNKTLQTEAMGGSWLQRNHHAIECLASVGTVICIYFVLPILKLPVPTVPETAWIMLGAFTGVTAWQRGRAGIATATAGA